MFLLKTIHLRFLDAIPAITPGILLEMTYLEPKVASTEYPETSNQQLIIVR